MGEFKEFLKSRTFFINLAIALVLFALVFGGAGKFLSWYTHHGEFTVLPDLSKKSLKDVEKLLTDKGLKYVIIDSSYDEKLPPQTVINQIPYVGAHVKNGRNIYLYITSTVPPLVEIPPSVVDANFEIAKQVLMRQGFKIGTITKQVNICVDCVLEIHFKGKLMAPGDKLPVGSRLDLGLGKSVNEQSDVN
ncbi:MAG TPA: PASTA domain-containing protein [Bacteroidia bacterium]|nr:PASTA domain-containing protein [Bacteroidia bacterium]